MKLKKKGMEMNLLGGILIAVAVTVVVVISIAILTGKGSDAIDYIVELFRFR